MYTPMTLEELLNTCRNHVLRDLVEDYLWSDERVVDLLNEAYMDFAEQSFMLRDASGDYAITLEEGVTSYELDDTVLLVLSMRVPGQLYDLRRVARDAAPVSEPEVVAFSTDEAARTLTVYGVPSAAMAGVEVPLRVARLPAKLFSLEEMDATCELPRQFAMALPYGAAALAYADQDADGGDPVRARQMQAVFDRYVARASRHARMSMFQPATFAFGGGGFSHG